MLLLTVVVIGVVGKVVGVVGQGVVGGVVVTFVVKGRGGEEASGPGAESSSTDIPDILSRYPDQSILSDLLID